MHYKSFSVLWHSFGASLIAQLVKNPPAAMQKTPAQFLGWKIPWRRDRLFLGFPGGSDGKESSCNEGDLGSIPGLGRSPGGGHGNPLLYSCLKNPMDRGAWRARCSFDMLYRDVCHTIFNLEKQKVDY